MFRQRIHSFAAGNMGPLLSVSAFSLLLRHYRLGHSDAIRRARLQGLIIAAGDVFSDAQAQCSGLVEVERIREVGEYVGPLVEVGSMTMAELKKPNLTFGDSVVSSVAVTSKPMPRSVIETILPWGVLRVVEQPAASRPRLKVAMRCEVFVFIICLLHSVFCF